jgi:hypothetical protein
VDEAARVFVALLPHLDRVVGISPDAKRGTGSK